uniref:Myosin light chain kinase, smooth muscle n=1 Tax=Cyprinus carpio TaxID=7962 RepID=A0A8C1N1V8_CYPCA
MDLFCTVRQLEVVKPLKDKTTIAGEQVEFTCVLNEAVPESEVTWYANGVELQCNDQWAMRASGSSYSLILKKAQAQHTQEITFAARDALSIAKLITICKCPHLCLIHYNFCYCAYCLTFFFHFVLIFIAVPDPPEDPELLTHTSLVLSWSGPCFDGGSAITGYVVEFQRLDRSEPSDWTELINQCPNTSYRVRSGLDPQGQYHFRVRAYNAAGVSDPSEESDCIKMNTAGEPLQEVTSYVEVVPDTTHKARDHYQVHEKLGVGKFGEVYRMTHKQTGRVCAGKFYRARVSREKTAARQEIKLMKEIHHPKLVQCLAAYDTPSEIVMILEYIAGGELFERIVDENFDHTEPNSVNYMRQILEGIQYIHSKRIVHLDLKPENIVCVNSAGTLIKIIDFGLASKLEPGKHLMVLHGTPEFVAPEVVNYEPVDVATDMWSIGVICYILLSGESPFQGNSDAETLALVTAAQWDFNPESFDDITEEAKDFISSLLRKDKRLSCEKALAHPWIALFDDSNSRSAKSLNKDKIRRFLARQKWKVWNLKKLLAAVLETRSPVVHLRWFLIFQVVINTNFLLKLQIMHTSVLSQKTEAEQAVASLEKQLWSEPCFHRALHDLTESCGATVHLACTIQGTVLLTVFGKKAFSMFLKTGDTRHFCKPAEMRMHG